MSTLTAHLFTQNGTFHVADVELPPFVVLPDLIIWGQRFFIAPSVTTEVRRLERAAGEAAYVEAFTYAVPMVGHTRASPEDTK